jgi:4,5-epoxidase
VSTLDQSLARGYRKPNLILGSHFLARLLRDRVIIPLMNRSLLRPVWEDVSQLKVSYRNGPLRDGRTAGCRQGHPAGRPGG